MAILVLLQHIARVDDLKEVWHRLIDFHSMYRSLNEWQINWPNCVSQTDKPFCFSLWHIILECSWAWLRLVYCIQALGLAEGFLLHFQGFNAIHITKSLWGFVGETFPASRSELVVCRATVLKRHDGDDACLQAIPLGCLWWWNAKDVSCGGETCWQGVCLLLLTSLQIIVN